VHGLAAGTACLLVAACAVAGTGDFDGDGFGDILWRDNLGNTSVWLMNGSTVKSAGSLGNVPTTWTVAGTGDFNADGKADLLWRNSSGGLKAIAAD
jgi:FG-GAP-like repeat